MFDLDSFVSNSITRRASSMFLADIEQYSSELNKKINKKSVLVIGGAGSIGSSFIIVLLRYKPS